VRVALEDVLATLSTGAIIYGVAMIYVPAAWIAAGAMGLGVAIMLAAGRRKRGDPDQTA